MINNQIFWESGKAPKVGQKVAAGWYAGWKMLEEDDETGMAADKEEDNQSDFQLFAAKLWLIQKGLSHSPVKLFIRPISSHPSRQLTHRDIEIGKTAEKSLRNYLVWKLEMKSKNKIVLNSPQFLP